jgi:hypothetical protein
MHVFSNVIKYLMKGEIAVKDNNGRFIKINFEIFKVLEADEFPELEFFTIHGNTWKFAHKKEN